MGCCSSNSIAPHDEKPELRLKITQVVQLITQLKAENSRKLMIKTGCLAHIQDTNAKIAELTALRDDLVSQRKAYLAHVAERDADDIRRACKGLGTDKSSLVSILTNRTISQIMAVDEEYKRKFGMSLVAQMREELLSAAGGLFTGALSDLGRFLENISEAQGDRDARLMHECLRNTVGTNDTVLIELISTRSNAEMQAAKESYRRLYNTSLEQMLEKKITFKNYRNLALRVVSCQRDETNRPFDDATALMHANHIRDKFQGNIMCCPFDGSALINAMGTISHAQFESLQKAYPYQQLIQHINDQTGGDFRTLLLALASDQNEYLARRLNTALNGMTGVDKETISRYVSYALLRPSPSCIMRVGSWVVYPKSVPPRSARSTTQSADSMRRSRR